MNSEIISALILGAATIIAAIVGRLVAIKVQNFASRSDESGTGEQMPGTSTRGAHWKWGIGGAVIGAVSILVFFALYNQSKHTEANAVAIETPTSTFVPSSEPTVIPTTTFTSEPPTVEIVVVTPTPNPTIPKNPLIMISNCQLYIGQEVHLAKNARFWTEPDVSNRKFESGTPGSIVYIKSGPEYGPITYTGGMGWWWEVVDGSGVILGWVYEARFQECE